ncbi:hypothetical protein RJZ57_006693, partial [Blastomyces gilchristii]
TYETLGSALNPDISYTAREFRRSALVYHVVRTYNLSELETLAKKYIEHFEKSISIFNILQAVRKMFSKHSDHKVWLLSYIKTKLEKVFVSDETTFKRDKFHCELGEDQVFHKAVMRMIVNIYCPWLLFMRSTLDSQKSRVEAGAEDLPADRYLDKMSPAEEHVTEAYLVEDTAAEAYLIEECAIEEPPAEAYPVKEPAEEEPAPEEPSFEDCPVEDPLAEDPPQEEPLTEAYPVEEPLVEECPIGEPPAETYATDQHPAEEPPLEEHPDVSLYAN